MLVELADEICDTVADLCQDWKLANITPIFKKGKKSSVSSYRPVSLTVNLCKVLESILRYNMIGHLHRHSLIKSSQHGFVRNRSCLITNLLVFLLIVNCVILIARPNMLLFQDLDKKLNTLVLQSPAVSEETEKCKRYGCLNLEIVVMMLLLS